MKHSADTESREQSAEPPLEVDDPGHLDLHHMAWYKSMKGLRSAEWTENDEKMERVSRPVAADEVHVEHSRCANPAESRNASSLSNDKIRMQAPNLEEQPMDLQNQDHNSQGILIQSLETDNQLSQSLQACEKGHGSTDHLFFSSAD